MANTALLYAWSDNKAGEDERFPYMLKAVLFVLVFQNTGLVLSMLVSHTERADV